MKKRYVLVDAETFESIDQSKVLYQMGHNFYDLFDTGVTYVPNNKMNIDKYVPDMAWGDIEDLYKTAKTNMRNEGYLFLEEDVITVVR